MPANYFSLVVMIHNCSLIELLNIKLSQAHNYRAYMCIVHTHMMGRDKLMCWAVRVLSNSFRLCNRQAFAYFIKVLVLGQDKQDTDMTRKRKAAIVKSSRAEEMISTHVTFQSLYMMKINSIRIIKCMLDMPFRYWTIYAFQCSPQSTLCYLDVFLFYRSWNFDILLTFLTMWGKDLKALRKILLITFK